MQTTSMPGSDLNARDNLGVFGHVGMMREVVSGPVGVVPLRMRLTGAAVPCVVTAAQEPCWLAVSATIIVLANVYCMSAVSQALC